MGSSGDYTRCGDDTRCAGVGISTGNLGGGKDGVGAVGDKKGGPNEQALDRRASGQHGLITRSQAVKAGLTPEKIERRVVKGRWLRVGPGVYRLAGAPVTWRQRALAACLVAGPGAVVSHRAAAVVFDVSGFRPGRIEITVPMGRGSRNPLATVHRSRRLPASDCTVREGVPVSSPARLVVDLAGCVVPDVLVEAVDDILCRRLVSLEELSRRVDQIGSRKGSASLRRVLEAWSPGPVPAGVAEMALVRRLLGAGLPVPERQHEIRLDDDLVARVDLAYPQAKLAIEFDGFQWHAGRGSFSADRRRQNRVEAAGWRVLRATTETVGDGGELCDLVRRVLRSVA